MEDKPYDLDGYLPAGWYPPMMPHERWRGWCRMPADVLTACRAVLPNRGIVPPREYRKTRNHIAKWLLENMSSEVKDE
jgi:hypothetical protein